MIRRKAAQLLVEASPRVLQDGPPLPVFLNIRWPSGIHQALYQFGPTRTFTVRYMEARQKMARLIGDG